MLADLSFARPAPNPATLLVTLISQYHLPVVKPIDPKMFRSNTASVYMSIALACRNCCGFKFRPRNVIVSRAVAGLRG